MARVLSFVVLVLLCATPTAQAGILTWRFSGFVESSMLDDVPVGTPVSFDVHVDTSATDSCPEEDSGFFSLPGSDMQSGDRHTTSDWTAFEVDNPAGNCMAMAGASTLRLVGFSGGSVASASIGVPYGGDADVLPLLSPSLGSTYFYLARYWLMSPDAWGTVTLTEVIPEPSVLVTTGLALLLGLLRRTRA